MNKIEKDRYIARVSQTQNNIQIWGQYNRLVEFIYAEYPKSKRRFDEISFPMLFILSHCIELGLKENIRFFSKYHPSIHLNEFESMVELEKSHDLTKLTKVFKITYNRLHKKAKATKDEQELFSQHFKKLEELVKILERDAETYRYSSKLDKDGNFAKKGVKPLKTIDLLHIEELFKDVNTLFIGAPNTLGRYTDYVDFINGNPDYKNGKGYLYCQKLPHSDEFLEEVKAGMNSKMKKISDNRWLNQTTAENFEIQVWEDNIYIIAVK